MNADKFPRHDNSLHLCHNMHKGYYETVEQYLEGRQVDPEEIESEDERQRMIATNEVWELQWYPNNAITSYAVYASTLESCLAFAKKIESEIQ